MADFFCAELRVVIAIDGTLHHDQREADLTRQRALEATGLRVVRVWASDVEADVNGVLDPLAKALSTAPSPLVGEGEASATDAEAG